MRSTLLTLVFADLYISFFSWRMDKRTPRWRNVPPPNKNEQITLIGTCFQMVPNGNLCVDLDSIALPSSMLNLANPSTPVREMTVSKRRKFASRAPPRTVMPVGVESNEQTLYGFLPKSVFIIPLIILNSTPTPQITTTVEGGNDPSYVLSIESSFS